MDNPDVNCPIHPMTLYNSIPTRSVDGQENLPQNKPHSLLAWVDESESIDSMNISEDIETGNIVNVNLEYPVEIHY